jgi:hypothetical protein
MVHYAGIVLSRLGKVFVVLTLAATLCAQWALLQTVAWTTMLAGNLKSCSLHDAVAMTFDGQHPCPLCKAIAAAKKSEQKNHVAFERQKMEFPPIRENLVLIAPPAPKHFPSANLFAKSLSRKPLTPPPRRFSV